MDSTLQAQGKPKHHGGAPQAILHPASRHLFSYWNGLRGEQGAPGREDIDLRGIAAILPWIGIIERRSGTRAQCWRLAGTGVARLWGHGLAGTEIFPDWPALYRRALVRGLDGIADRRQPFVARIKAVTGSGEALGIEFLAVPIEARDGSVQAMCAVVPFREPHWLGRVPLIEVEVSTLTALWLGPLPDEITGLRGSRPGQPRFRLIQGGRGE